jgi:hypothetical protein
MKTLSMKTICTLLLATAFLLIASRADSLAVTTTFYGLNISATLSTDSVSGSTYSFTTQHFNNHTITNAIFATGTTGAPKASDLAIVFGGTGIAVINTASTSSTNKIIATIAMTGSNNTSSGELFSSTKSAVKVTVSQTDLEFTLPGVPNVQITNFRLSEKVDFATGVMSKFLISFFGGYSASSIAGSTLFQGTLMQDGKVYSSP